MSKLRPYKDFGLSPTEEAVATWLSAGLMNKQIAIQLQMKEDAVKSAVRRIKYKIGARTRSHAVAILYRGGR
jgi:DNA-binding HTH domain-containing proteins